MKLIARNICCMLIITLLIGSVLSGCLRPGGAREQEPPQESEQEVAPTSGLQEEENVVSNMADATETVTVGALTLQVPPGMTGSRETIDGGEDWVGSTGGGLFLQVSLRDTRQAANATTGAVATVMEGLEEEGILDLQTGQTVLLQGVEWAYERVVGLIDGNYNGMEAWAVDYGEDSYYVAVGYSGAENEFQQLVEAIASSLQFDGSSQPSTDTTVDFSGAEITLPEGATLITDGKYTNAGGPVGDTMEALVGEWDAHDHGQFLFHSDGSIRWYPGKFDADTYLYQGDFTAQWGLLDEQGNSVNGIYVVAEYVTRYPAGTGEMEDITETRHYAFLSNGMDAHELELYDLSNSVTAICSKQS